MLLPKEKQRERAEWLKKQTWTIAEPNGNEFTATFGQLCCYFGIRYNSMYKRVVNYGMDVEKALEICRSKPKCWGATYYNGRLAKGVWGENSLTGRKLE